MLINLCIFQKSVFEDGCVALESFKELASLFLVVSIHELLVESFISQLLAFGLLPSHSVIDGIIATSKRQN